MSLESWKKEFYLESAAKAAERGPKAALLHSIKKWDGTTKAALGRHDVRFSGAAVSGDREYLVFDSMSCALCRKYIDSVKCHKCPIVKATGVDCIAAYKKSEWGDDSSPMRRLLKRVYNKLYPAKKEKRK